MKKNKPKSGLILLSLLAISALTACNNDVENLEDLREVGLEENPTLINGLRLGFVKDIYGFDDFGISRRTRSSIPFYCEECEKWRGFEEDQSFDHMIPEDEHSYASILYSERSFWFLKQEDVVPTDQPNIVYVKEGGSYVRTILTSEEDESFHYVHRDGHQFEQKEPIAYFEGLKEMVMMRSSSFPKGVFANADVFIDEGKDTILTEVRLNFKSTNNPPLKRLIYDLEDGILYRKGQIVDFEVDDFERLYDECKEGYVIALNESEVKEIIAFFEGKFGKRKYKTENCSGDFKRPKEKSFYREYRWSVGIVNIILQIHDFQPENVVGFESENPYLMHRGYSVNAMFKLNDKVMEIIEKEN